MFSISNWFTSQPEEALIEKFSNYVRQRAYIVMRQSRWPKRELAAGEWRRLKGTLQSNVFEASRCPTKYCIKLLYATLVGSGRSKLIIVFGIFDLNFKN